jgi:signal transduction histidine kinase
MPNPFSNKLLLALAFVALMVVAGLLWYSNQLVSSLAEKEERLVHFWAATAEHIYNAEPDAGTLFLIDHVLLRTDTSMFQVPALLTDSAGQRILQHNLTLPSGVHGPDSARYLQEVLMDIQSSGEFSPIRLELPGGSSQFVYFRESDEVLQLRYFPYITVVVLVLFMGIVFLTYYFLQKSQLNRVWVGLARETAHQLGTPISALVGWVELLKLQAETDAAQASGAEIAHELEKDIQQLELIADRFSKIGSRPELVSHNLAESIRKSVAYYQKRASASVQWVLEDQTHGQNQAQVSPILFEWVIENLLKNALDAQARNIRVVLETRGNQLLVDVQDDGKGIPPSLVRKVFRPGFTTKKRGWGLGLSLAKRIIEEYHAGRIFVKHSEPEQGTTFRIQLPR